MKAKFVAAAVIALAAVGCTQPVKAADQGDILWNPLFADGKSITLATGGNTLDYVTSWVEPHQNINFHVYSYNVTHNGQHIGWLGFYTANIDNGDIYYMLKYIPATTSKTPFSVYLHLNGNQSEMTERHTYKNGADDYVFTSPAVVRGKVTPNTIMGQSQQYSVMLSRTDEYTPAPNSTYTEQPTKVQSADYDQIASGSVFGFNFTQQPGLIGEQWGVISEKPLMNWNDAYAVSNLSMNDLNDSEKWTSQGTLSWMLTEYTPYAPNRLWRKPVNYSARAFVEYNWIPVFYDMGLVQLNWDVLKHQTSAGYWVSTTGDTWLQGTYDIPAGYFDTRFNTDTADYLLLSAYVNFKDPESLAAVKRYVSFFENYAEVHSRKTANGGILVCDYMSPGNPAIRTHTSLNHDVAEMNFLLDYYQATGDTTALRLAKEYKQGVDDTGLRWVKKNNDLFYEVNPDGTFTGNDYPNLTLHDLEHAQDEFKQVFGSTDPVFDALINHKSSYCTMNHIPQ